MVWAYPCHVLLWTFSALALAFAVGCREGGRHTGSRSPICSSVLKQRWVKGCSIISPDCTWLWRLFTFVGCLFDLFLTLSFTFHVCSSFLPQFVARLFFSVHVVSHSVVFFLSARFRLEWLRLQARGKPCATGQRRRSLPQPCCTKRPTLLLVAGDVA